MLLPHLERAFRSFQYLNRFCSTIDEMETVEINRFAIIARHVVVYSRNQVECLIIDVRGPRSISWVVGQESHGAHWYTFMHLKPILA